MSQVSMLVKMGGVPAGVTTGCGLGGGGGAGTLVFFNLRGPLQGDFSMKCFCLSRRDGDRS